MTSEELQAYRDRLEEILKADEPTRTNRLVNLMNDMEWTYHIPTNYDFDYAKQNPEVVKLYRRVREAQYFGEVR
jgi:hypothetical protein